MRIRQQKLLVRKSHINPCLHTSRTRKPTKSDSNIIQSLLLSNPILSLLKHQCKSLSQLKQIQSQMTITGLISNPFASSFLIAFCAESEPRSLEHCTKILYNTKKPTLYSWNVTIRGFVDSGNPKEAIFMYKRMLGDYTIRPDNFTYPILCKAYTSLVSNFTGCEILCHVMKLGFDCDVYVHNAILKMLVSVGELGLAYKVFDEGCVRDLVSWNTLINGFVRMGQPREAIVIYNEMVKEGVKPDDVTMVSVTSSCAKLEDLELGREYHGYINESGLDLTVPLANSLLYMYVKCGDLEAAKLMFDNMEEKTIVSWTTMIVGYAKHGLLDVARRVFRDMPETNVVAWNSMIGACVQAKYSKEALELFHEMQNTGTKPDRITMVYCLSACAQLGELDLGTWIHRYIEKFNLSLDVAFGTALVDMYAKCGNIVKALQVFHDMPGRNSLTWTAIIGGLALHGNPRDAISYFSKMIKAGLLPDEITFLEVLSACCHGGLVEEGRKHFTLMKSKFNLSPQTKHYSCMVDLLGRAGLLNEAEELIKSMPMQADAAVWGALFSACRIHGNIKMGQLAATKLIELDPQDSGIYVLLANMYKEANMLNEAEEVRKLMRGRGVEKTPGSSSIAVNGAVCEFISRDKSHHCFESIRECLTWLTRESEFVECNYYGYFS